MANTQIRLLRAITQQHPTAYNWVTGNNGTITNGEPWVNVANKQLWVDNKCINPELTLGSVAGQYFSLNHDLTSTYNATTTLEFDFDALKEALDIPTIPTLYALSFTKGANTVEYNPANATQTITFGEGLEFNNGVLSSSVTKDSYLDDVQLVNEDASGNEGTFLKFMWNTAAGKTDIYVDVAEFYDDTDTDTKTQLEGVTNNPIEVSLLTNSGVWTADALNTYSVVHKAITVPTDITTTTNPGYGGTFQIIKGVQTDGYGHITGFNTETIKMPDATDIPEYQASKLSGNISNDHKTATWLLDNGVNGTVNVAHAAQDSNGVGSMVEFTAINQDTANSVYDITMQVTVIDGGTC